MSKNEAKNPFYKPLWVRIVLVGVLIAWSSIEWLHGETIWGVLAGALTLWAIWIFFVTFDPDTAGAADDSAHKNNEDTEV